MPLDDVWDWLALDKVKPETRHEAFRNTALIVLAFLGGGLAIWRSSIARKDTQINHQNSLTNTFNQAISQLGSQRQGGSANIEVRLGGIYGLEKLASINAAEYHQVIMDILCSYIRHNAPLPGIKTDTDSNTDTGVGRQAAPEDRVQLDIQTALTIIARHQTRHDESSLDLSSTNLAGYSLSKARLTKVNLQKAKLQGANLQKADLKDANLKRANLKKANLKRANLKRANLQGANLQKANLEGANLQGTDLQEANLEGAHLQGTNLRKADLQGADLQGADFRGADLQGADLQGANLQGADFQGVKNLHNANLDEANLQGAKNLPEDLEI